MLLQIWDLMHKHILLYHPMLKICHVKHFKEDTWKVDIHLCPSNSLISPGKVWRKQNYARMLNILERISEAGRIIWRTEYQYCNMAYSPVFPCAWWSHLYTFVNHTRTTCIYYMSTYEPMFALFRNVLLDKYSSRHGMYPIDWGRYSDFGTVSEGIYSTKSTCNTTSSPLLRCMSYTQDVGHCSSLKSGWNAT